MSVTVKQINELKYKNKDVENIIKEQLHIIDDKLLQTKKNKNADFIIHQLPTNVVGIIGIEKQDLQRIIYSTIIYSLEKRGFDVKIVLDQDTSILYISWKSEMDSETINAMNNIIKNKKISKTELYNLTNK